jgi:hypothetical protein
MIIEMLAMIGLILGTISAITLSNAVSNILSELEYLRNKINNNSNKEII